jgi:ferredoxin-NADP reductase
VKVGDTIEALGRAATSRIDATLRRSAVLIGAGVGITPMVSFARHLVAEGFRLRRTRPTHLIQVARDGQVRAFASELQALATRADGALKLHIVQDDGAPGAWPARSPSTRSSRSCPSTTTSSSSAARPASCRPCTTACANSACATSASRPKPSGRRR